MATTAQAESIALGVLLCLWNGLYSTGYPQNPILILKDYAFGCGGDFKIPCSARHGRATIGSPFVVGGGRGLASMELVVIGFRTIFY